ncbi:hypothetical protein X798_00098 [Onchocerca flexuosa]|uniref:Uncharacterized protein n=1 Tax=Onchocerca flexuosa TaxID=387005 RepID=A0A238C4R7_9BILA|nr:hypothetical protein X798_00098 [Onchocerca flexuosa]
MSSTHSKDYAYDVHMDINHQFFPLPSVAIPNIEINQPSVTEYNFESERKAIADYEKNKAALAVKVKEMKTKNVTSERQSNAMLERMPDIVRESQTRKVHSGVILKPSRVVATTSQQQNTKSMKPTLNTFEEFESKPNLFDLLELSTIDDKAALEQILTNVPSQLSSSVVGNTAQSSSGLLSSSSVPNMDLNVSKTENTHNLYNLTTTLKGYNSSFGIGVPSASFRQNS